MQGLPHHSGRKMIPRWRGLRLTPSMELLSARDPNLNKSALVHSESVVEEWKNSPSPWTAADVVAMALVEGRTAESDRAAYYLQPRLNGLSLGARQLVLAYLDPVTGPIAPVIFQTAPEVKWRHIAELKAEIRVYPRNAILYVDLARAHVALGQTKPAKRAFEIALALAPSSRYVIRCAVRFFVFEGELERAWSLVGALVTNDPWLVACKISIADLAEKPQLSLRSSRRIIDAGDPGQITELAASVATLELSAGSNKMAKKLFRQGAERPTDNTVAQLRWAHETAGIPFDSRLLETELSFEARTGQAIEQQDWKSATHHASIWLGDEPFSTRAASLGAFIAAEMLQDFNTAEAIASRGLIVNHNDPILLNNRAYSRACLGNIAGARDDLKRARAHVLERTDELCLLATEGCIEYRSGDPILGSELYHRSIIMGEAIGNLDYSQRSFIHWINEDGLLGRRIPEPSASKIRSFFDDPKKITKETRSIYEIYALPFLTGGSIAIEESDLLHFCDDLISVLRS